MPPNQNRELASLRGTQYGIGDLLRLLQVELPERVAHDKTSFLLTTLQCRESLYRADSKFHNLYIVLSGLLMTSLLDEDGTDRPTSFPGSGDIVGIDGVEDGKYRSDTVALTPSLILTLPFKTIMTSMEIYPELQLAFRQLAGHELVRTRKTMHVLRNYRSEARVAHFIFEIAEKLTNLELENCPFRLPISRREIANFLGLTYETISRTLAALHHQGVINVDGSNVTVLDFSKLLAIKKAPGK